jgi:hypothetical protein
MAVREGSPVDRRAEYSVRPIFWIQPVTKRYFNHGDDDIRLNYGRHCRGQISTLNERSAAKLAVLDFIESGNDDLPYLVRICRSPDPISRASHGMSQGVTISCVASWRCRKSRIDEEGARHGQQQWR